MVEIYSLGDIGRDDGTSQVELTQVKAICNQCGATYTDEESIDLAKKWIAQGYAPCPNLSCQGELEIKE
ncbi:unnamed protein product [marine sediment metagenome]|uniref:Uncharacterized protein n=1 Tax=marine sediment metagenome TaxID=412755 RepID=X1FUE5_9ZZZZ